MPVDFLQTQEAEGDTSIVTLELFIVIVVYDDDDDVDIVDPLWCIVTHYCCGALVVNKLFKWQGMVCVLLCVLYFFLNCLVRRVKYRKYNNF